MTQRFLSFDCCGAALAGIINEPLQPAGDVGILIVVGGPQYRVGSHRQFVLMARTLCAAGYPVLRFDYRGMGDSAGPPTPFEVAGDDIRHALDVFCSEVPNLRRVVVFGLCDAASAALMFATADARVRGLVLANPWVRTPAGEAKAYVKHYYGQRLLQRTFWKKALTGGLQVGPALRSFMQTLRRWAKGRAAGAGSAAPSFVERMEQGLERFTGPILLLISDRDLTAREFDDVCGSNPKWERLVSRRGVQRAVIVDSDHTFSTGDSMKLSSEKVVQWLAEVMETGHPQ